MNNVVSGVSRGAPSILTICAHAYCAQTRHNVRRTSSFQVMRNISSTFVSGVVGSRATCWQNAWTAASHGSHNSRRTADGISSKRQFHVATVLNKLSKNSPKRQRRDSSRQPSLSSYDEASLRSIFGARVSQQNGNAILQTIHQRRRSGELADVGLRLDKHLATAVSTDATKRALQWLRVNYPVDEQAAAEEWAAQEESKLNSEYTKSAERMGLYQSSNDPATQEQGSRGLQPGESVLEHYIKQNKERRVAEHKRKEESGELQRAENMQLARMEARRSELERRQEEKAQRTLDLHKQFHEKQSQKEVPDMSLLARLGPSTLFAAFVICGWVIYSEVYTPPLLSERLFPNVAASAVTVLAIIGINLVIFCAWRVVKLWPLMNMAFTVVPAYPYAVSVLGNCFSHQEFSHIFANMLGLAIYGIPLHEDIGRGNFLALYMSGGVAGSLLSLYYYVLGQRWGYYSRGASGCVFAIMMAWAWITAQKPQKDTSTFAFAWDVALYASIVIQISMHFTKGVMQKMDVFAHVGGSIVGLFGGFMLTRLGGGSNALVKESPETSAADGEGPSKVNEEREQRKQDQS